MTRTRSRLAGAALAVCVIGLAAFRSRERSNQVSDPKPEPAIPAILAAFDTFSIVAIGDVHRTKDITDFVLGLVRNPGFADKVNDFVVEGTNPLLQPTLDRYINGESVPYEEARKLWRETTTPFGSSDFEAQLFQLIREINRTRPQQRRIRVIASEAPVDWNAPREPGGADMDRREQRISSVVKSEVLARRRKALMFYGGGHLRRDRPYASSVELIEQTYPRSVFVVTAYAGVMDRDYCTSDSALDARMQSWPVPSVVRVRGNWMLDVARDEEARRPKIAMFATTERRDSTAVPIDAYLYLGPPRLLLREFPSVFTFADSAYLALLHQRQLSIGMTVIDARTNPKVVATQDQHVLRCGS
ncbi:MAG TPA: hypothetical protein VJR92_13260 [Gemmatimonadaceae bacterium]|nr:hypothetical protein [Gemmatimonadaceae bacterium]